MHSVYTNYMHREQGSLPPSLSFSLPLSLSPSLPPSAPGLLKAFYNSSYTFSQRLYGSLDVDLPCIRLCQSIGALACQPLLYVRGSIPQPCLRVLMCLCKLAYSSTMADVVRSDLFPTSDEVASLSLHFTAPTGLDLASGENPKCCGNSVCFRFNLSCCPVCSDKATIYMYTYVSYCGTKHFTHEFHDQTPVCSCTAYYTCIL